MNTLSTEVKYEAQRGLIVYVLVEWNLEWIPFHELRLQLSRRLGYPVKNSQIQFHLNYLVQGGYAESKLLRAGRADLELTVVRGTAKAVDLLDGRIPPDEGIANYE